VKRRALAPLEPVGSSERWALGVAFFALFIAGWAAVTYGGLVPPLFLADPLTMLRQGWNLFAQYDFLTDVGMTVWRVVGGFILAAAVGVPLGIAMGAYKRIEAFFEPFVSFCRYLPASAFIPLLILWAGIGEVQKLLVIFIGSFFQIVLMVAVTGSRPPTRWAPATAAWCAACCCPAPLPASPRSCGWCWAGPGPTSSSPS
jgi:NitT/TauT family transport system permease protein